MELRTYGSMDHPSYIDSISALFIVYLSFVHIETCLLYQLIYFSIFYINGISSCLAHNPYVAEHYPKFNYYMDCVDYLSIIVALIFSPFIFSSETLTLDNKLLFFFLNSIYASIIRLLNYDVILIFIFPVINLIGILFYYNRLFEPYFIVSTILALFFKINQDIFLFHSLWHIFGTLMFKYAYEIMITM